MVEALDNHSQTGFKYLQTGDQSWMTYHQTPIRMWAIDQSCIYEKVQPINNPQKTMITVFFGVDGIALLEVLPTAVKITSDYFCHNTIEALQQVLYPEGRVPGIIRDSSISIMHRSIRLKKFERNFMSVSFALFPGSRPI
jgi:hypothetical protein